ncbi:MAG: ABC transporter ATP-binding protein [Ruminococcus sp.]|nr:ABC transporter ATP-binding protein [Ruminococcus sp.]
MALLTCRDLCLGYEGKEILHKLNFSVEQGDYLCIVGVNGSGKSTLMKTILGLVPALSGEIIYDDGLQKWEIGYLPQQTDVQRDFPASVNEIVLSGFCARLGLRPFYSKAQKQLAQENMEKMGLTKLKKRCYRELSGGQQQRVLLARALCAAQKVLLLDEPVSGLDPAAAENMYELVRKLNKDDGITVIMITHDIHSALDQADKVLHMGENVFFGSREQYLERLDTKGFLQQGGADNG